MPACLRSTPFMRSTVRRRPSRIVESIPPNSCKTCILKGVFKMLVRREKRTDERIVSTAPIIFSSFSTRFWREYPSMTRNHSKHGMCFEANSAMTPGTYLFIRVERYSRAGEGKNQDAGLRTSTLAEVKWCRKLSDEPKSTYCVGVRYF